MTGQDDENQLTRGMMPPHRSLSEDEWRRFVVRCLDENTSRINDVAKCLETNTKVTREVAANTKGVVDMFEAVSGAFKVLDMLSRLAKPFAIITAFFVGVAAAYVEVRRRFF